MGADVRDRLWVVYSLFFSVWLAANFSAFSGAWWYADDFLFFDYSRLELLKGSLHHGRPGFGILLQFLHFEMPPEATVMNRVSRLFQGAMHVGAAVVFYRMVRPFLSPVGAALTAVPFLLWGLNGEATLWRAASMYPAAALLSLGGMHWIVQGWEIRRWSLISAGAILCLAAALTNQAAVTAGIMGYLIVVSLRGVSLGFDPKRMALEVGTVLPFFLVAAVISALLAQHFGSDRGGFADDWVAKWKFFGELTRSFLFFDGIYSPLTRWLHGLLIAGGAIVWAVSIVRRKLDAWGTTAVPLCLAAGFVVPYLPNLIIADSYPSLRIMYTAPLLMSAVIALTWRMGSTLPGARGVLVALVVLLGGSYAILAWENGREYVALYGRDVESAAAIEALARDHGTDRVLVVDLYRMREPWVDDNPYGFRIVHAGNRYSVFLYHWAAKSFLRWHTDLEPVSDELVLKYLEFPYDLPRDPPLQWHYIEEDDLVIVAPR